MITTLKTEQPVKEEEILISPTQPTITPEVISTLKPEQPVQEDVILTSSVMMNSNKTVLQNMQPGSHIMRFVIGFSISLVVVVFLSIGICIYIFCYGQKLNKSQMETKWESAHNQRYGNDYIKVSPRDKNFYD